MLPRGVRNRNPLNLVYNAGTAKYRGCTGNDGGYCVFDTPQNGVRAATLNLQTYAGKGWDTLRRIIEHWAPQKAGNDVVAYIKDVSGRTTWGADEPLALNVPSVVLALVKAMVWHENGQQPYTDAVLLEGINAALGGNG